MKISEVRADSMGVSVECGKCKTVTVLKGMFEKKLIKGMIGEFQIIGWKCEECGYKNIGQVDDAASRKKFYESLRLLKENVRRKRKGKFQTDQQQAKSASVRKELKEMREVLLGKHKQSLEEALNSEGSENNES